MTRVVGKDDEGWFTVECECGWGFRLAPSLDIAVDAYGDHRVDVATDAGA